MKKELKTLWIVVAVLAVLQIVGGCIYTGWTAVKEKTYTYVDCTVMAVQSTINGDSVTIDGITVSYVNEQGQTVMAQMADFPTSFAEGETFRARYQDDPLTLSVRQTDWFTPVFLLILGLAYALFDLGALLLRKKMGLYALVDITEDGQTDLTEEQTEQND